MPKSAKPELFHQAADAPLSALMAAGVAGGPTDLPQAGLGYLLFYNDLKLVDQGFASLTSQARVPQDAGALTSHPFERLALDEVIVEKTGFVYFFVASYDTKNVSVFFDDLAVAHRTTDVVYAADYYPHGQPMDGRTLQQKNYRYAYQGAFAEQDDETDLASFQLRQYDSRIGRWTTPDPYNQYWSPYLGMGNAPNMMIDPDGGAAGGGPSFWTRLKSFITGGNISNSGRFVFNSGRTFSWGAVGKQVLKTTATLASSNTWRLNSSNTLNDSEDTWSEMPFGEDQRDKMLHKAFIKSLNRIADMDAEEEFRERNPNAASRMERVFKSGVKAEDFGLRDDVFGGGADPMINSQINYYLQRANVRLTSYWKADNLVSTQSSALFKSGPAIILSGGGGDRFYATFESIKARDHFFRVHYNDRYLRRLKNFKDKLK